MIGHLQAEALLKQALSLSSARLADESEVVLLGLEEQLTRFANNAIHQHVAETNRYLVLRAALGRRMGVAATNDLTNTGLERAAESAIAAARLQPDDPHFPGLPHPISVPEIVAFDEATARCSPTERAQAVRTVCRRAEDAGCLAAGAFRTGVHEWAVANSHGLFVYHPATKADLTTVVMTGDSSGFAAGASWKVAKVDVVALGEEAITKAQRSRNPQPVEPGVYPVVLESYATHDLLETLSIAAGANPVQEGRSWMSERRGEQLMSPLISIWDDGRDPAGWPLPFDFEGVPRRRVDIVRGGIVGEVVYDRARAARDGQNSTGHALPVANPFNPWLNAARLGPIPLHAFMGTGESTIKEMIAGTERGLYVTRFWYTRTVHPREAVMTGMTRDGTFLIEHGEVTRPVRNLRFTQSYVEALAGAEAVGRKARRVWSDPGILSAPALKLAAFNFTGTTGF
ncbi:MAG: TldD/PmbA family protein [Chloroflexota bacterium]|nr:TldD/PmbA family protein [Chloroflexota bacterium]